MSTILQPDGTPFPPRKRRVIDPRLRANFDVAQTHNDNKQHWASTDSLSPNASVSPRIRQIIRNRARYEISNNSFLRGMVETKVQYVVGRGPRLQMKSGTDRHKIEEEWKRWCRKINFAAKLRTMLTAKFGGDGEGFAIHTNNRNRKPVQLGLREFECDHVTDSEFSRTRDFRNSRSERRLDGLVLDREGEPAFYHVLNHHPGADYYAQNSTDGKWVKAQNIVHLYRRDRPSQRRGIPYITPSLPLFAILRRYTLAALHQAEWASETNAIMKSAASMTGQEVDQVSEFLEIPWARNMLLTLPIGWDLEQLKTADSTTTFTQFYRQILNEAARCLIMPYNIAAADSSESNYASGRMDRLLFFKSVEIEIEELEINAVEEVFEAWLREYLSEKSGIAPSDIDVTEYAHEWGWDGIEDDDPEKVAKADQIFWNLGLITDEEWLSRRNVDPEKHYAQLVTQNEFRRENGLPLPGVAMQQIDAGDDTDEEETQEQDSEAGETAESTT